ncbi:hypothetical protein FJ956_25010 [Mesorhizobium sp. B2-4-3]|nr:hypothetical protein FJ956_25010 [Mesorhizobium sp. B2-4-3]
MTAAGDHGAGREALTIYILLAVALMAVGVFTVPIAAVMACLGLFRRDTPSWLRSHYGFQLRSILIFLLSLAAIFTMLPGAAGGVAWASYVMLVGVADLGCFLARCIWGLAILYRRNGRGGSFLRGIGKCGECRRR